MKHPPSRQLSGLLAFCVAAVFGLNQGLARSRQGATQDARGVVPTIERSLSRLARTKPARDLAFKIAGSWRGSVWIRPASKVVEVRRWLTTKTFLIREGGVLSPADRLQLDRQIAQVCPGATGGMLRRNLLLQLTRHNRHQRTLRQQQDKGHQTSSSGSFQRQGSYSVPIRVGPFRADGKLHYSVFVPRATGTAAAGATGQKVAANLPLSAAVARTLAPGTELRLEGEGKTGLHGDGSPRIGFPILSNLAMVNASLGAGLDLSKSSRLSFRVKRLDGDKVLVALSQDDAGQAAASLNGQVSATVPVTELAKAARVNLGPGVIAKKAQGLVNGVTEWARARFAATFERTRNDREVKSWVLDLAKDAGAKAFDGLIRLDSRLADALGGQGEGSGVAIRQRNQYSKNQGFSVQANLGSQISLLNWAQNNAESSQVLTSPEGNVSINRIKFGESYSDLLSNLVHGKRSRSTQFLQVKRPGRPLESYLHVRRTVKGDAITSEADLHRFLAFADLVGAGSARTAELRRNIAVYRERLDNNFGRSSRTVDMYVTDAGLTRLAQASAEQINSAFGKAYETLDRPTQVDIHMGDLHDVWSRTPWLVKEDPNHATLMKLLETPSGSSRWKQADLQYRRITGRSLAVDSTAWRMSQQIVSFAARLRRAQTPTDRAREFAKISGRLDLGKGLATIGMVAGRENLLFNEVSLHGERGFNLTVGRRP